MKLMMTGQLMLSNLTAQEANKIKSDLTFDNPAYKQAKQFSKWHSTTVDPYVRFYKEFDSCLIVPRGYKLPYIPKTVEDNRVKVRALFPKFRMTLRGAQEKAYEAFTKSSGSGLIILPTGVGKTILALYIAGRVKQKTLIVVQKNDLIVGWTKDIHETYGITKDKIGLIKAKERRTGRIFTLCTIQTLNRLNPTEILNLSKEFGLIILDECHHIIATSYKILSNLCSRYTLGLTATDTRGDGLSHVIPMLFGEVIFRAKNEDTHDAILPVTVIVKETSIKYQGDIRYKSYGKILTEEEANKYRAQGKYVERMGMDSHERDAVIDMNKEYNDLVVKDVIAEASKNKSCVVFCKKLYQLDFLHKLIELSGFDMSRVGKYVGGTKSDADFIAKAESKEIIITLTTLKKSTEGTNVKAWEKGFLVTSLKQTGDVIQAVGRVRRRTTYHKDAVIYDYRHPLVNGLKTHETNRDKAYKQIDAKVLRPRSAPMMTRGFR
jgi:superfamily II DNA or RNA helicase